MDSPGVIRTHDLMDRTKALAAELAQIADTAELTKHPDAAHYISISELMHHQLGLMEEAIEADVAGGLRASKPSTEDRSLPAGFRAAIRVQGLAERLELFAKVDEGKAAEAKLKQMEHVGVVFKSSAASFAKSAEMLRDVMEEIRRDAALEHASKAGIKPQTPGDPEAVIGLPATSTNLAQQPAGERYGCDVDK